MIKEKFYSAVNLDMSLFHEDTILILSSKEFHPSNLPLTVVFLEFLSDLNFCSVYSLTYNKVITVPLTNLLTFDLTILESD